MSVTAFDVDDLETEWRNAPDGFAAGFDFKVWLVGQVVQLRAAVAEWEKDREIRNQSLSDILAGDSAIIGSQEQRIAAAVAAEREACAKVADDVVDAALTPPKNSFMARIASSIAAAIRARNGAQE